MNVNSMVSEWVQVFFAVAGLVLLTPLIVFVCLAVKLDSRGDAFFLQERVGMDGRIFVIYKFRTFKKNTTVLEPSPSEPNDTRLSRVGKVLRRYSLDEIPQLVNVIKRDINIVGPRALVFDALVERAEYLIKKDPANEHKYKYMYFVRRQEVRPGITGLAQVCGRSSISVEESLGYDMRYVEDRSFLLDIMIILKTFTTVFSGKDSN